MLFFFLGDCVMCAHAFMDNTIEQAATATERRAGFIADAKVARQEMFESGKGFAAEGVDAYLKSKLSGKKTTKPKARSWYT